ncbi:MAG: carbohydrate kinase family protein [Methanobrevibacter sp.]|nr:carbohydrate kinase family protein [Candidatus Methanoflexus mossambicus]
MTKKNDLLSIGHTAFDYIIKINEFPKPNSSATIEEMKNLHGGAAANVAVVASKLGLNTSLLSAVGDDFLHSKYKLSMENLNIDLDYLIHVKDENTSTAFVHTDSNNDQVSYFYWGASSEFKNTPVDEEAIKNYETIHLATGDPDFNYRVSKIAKEYNKFVSFDPGQDLHTYPDENLNSLLKNVDILFGNQFEINSILKRLNLNINSLIDLGPKTIIKTMGEKGSIIYDDYDSQINIDAIVKPAADPTGAGDSFRAGFFREYLNGKSLENSAKFASSVSSFIVEKLGCQTNIPTYEEAKKRMNEFYNK